MLLCSWFYIIKYLKETFFHLVILCCLKVKQAYPSGDVMKSAGPATQCPGLALVCLSEQNSYFKMVKLPVLCRIVSKNDIA